MEDPLKFGKVKYERNFNKRTDGSRIKHPINKLYCRMGASREALKKTNVSSKMQLSKQ